MLLGAVLSVASILAAPAVAADRPQKAIVLVHGVFVESRPATVGVASKIKGPGASGEPGPLLKPKSVTPLPDRGGLA
jgi:hypothetical protein